MAQDFLHISPAEKISNSLQKLLNRDVAALTMFSGTREPDTTMLNEDMVGIWLDRTDLKIIKRLASVTPNVVWEDLFNYGSYVPTKPEIDAAFQPLDEALTLLSTVTPQNGAIPYFVSDSQMSVITLKQWAVQFLQSADSAAARKSLGLGALAVQDTIDGSQIANKSIGIEKLNFDVSSAGYDTGDVMETMGTKRLSDGWVLMNGGTIGNKTSNATAAADNSCEKLFKMLWPNANLKIYGPDGIETSRASADQDWSNSRQLALPDPRGRIMIGTSNQADVAKLTSLPMSTAGSTARNINLISVKCYIRL